MHKGSEYVLSDIEVVENRRDIRQLWVYSLDHTLRRVLADEDERNGDKEKKTGEEKEVKWGSQKQASTENADRCLSWAGKTTTSSLATFQINSSHDQRMER